MSRFNTNTSHPIIPNAQQYMFEQKYVTFHSEDRDVVKYPSSSDFEIELPQDYCNVQSVKLVSWTFPSNYNTFSASQYNISMQFSFVELNPLPASPTALETAIYNGLSANLNNSYTVVISEGFYNPISIAFELTNRMNEAVTNYLKGYLFSVGGQSLVQEFVNGGGYTGFVVSYNFVNSKLWFGNTDARFLIPNLEQNVFLRHASLGKFQYPVYSNWGLNAYLGFNKCEPVVALESPYDSNVGMYTSPRFNHMDPDRGDAGYWLTNGVAYNTTPVYYLEAPCKINIMGEAYFYMDVDLLNNMDEFVPYELNAFTTHTNESCGVVNSTFAKIPICSAPLSQDYENDMPSYKLFNPPAERIKKLKFRLRYHNGLLVDFGKYNYSFTLQFDLFRPQNQKKYQMYIPETMAYPPLG